MQLCSHIIHILPLEVHQQAKALRIKFVALTLHDFFEDECKAFLLLLSCLLIHYGRTSCSSRLLRAQQATNRFETLLCVSQLLQDP